MIFFVNLMLTIRFSSKKQLDLKQFKKQFPSFWTMVIKFTGI